MKEQIKITYRKGKGQSNGALVYEVSMSDKHLEQVITDLQAMLEERKPQRNVRTKTVHQNPNPNYRPPIGKPKLMSAICLAIVGTEDAVAEPYFIERG